MKTLITGATGFIGSFLVEELHGKGHDVTCLVRNKSDLKWLKGLGPELLHADLSDPDTYASKLKVFDYIYHLAGLTKAPNESDFFAANADCTRKLSAAVQKYSSPMRFLHVSSLAAAGPSMDGLPLTEDSPPHPVSAYGKSKLEGENAVMGIKDSVPVTVVRPPAVYGPRDTDFFLVFKAVQNRIFPDWGDSSYSLVHVHDLVRGLILAAESDNSAGRIYYISDGRTYTNDDILSALESALHKKALRLRLPRYLLPAISGVIQKIQKKGIINPDKIKEIQYPHWTCSPEKAVKEIGFRATIPLGEGFSTTADWYRKEKWL